MELAGQRAGVRICRRPLRRQPSYPDLKTLWKLTERTAITHFGTSPKFLDANAEAGFEPAEVADLSRLRSLMSTGSPLNPWQYDWVYANLKGDLQPASISGGTGLIGCFAGSVPVLPVRRGELQGRLLGMAVDAWNQRGEAVIGEKGELVCTKPFPSMPLGFWGDQNASRYCETLVVSVPAGVTRAATDLAECLFSDLSPRRGWRF